MKSYNKLVVQDDKTVLVRAILEGRLEAMETLLWAGADIHAFHEVKNGATSHIYSCLCFHLPMPMFPSAYVSIYLCFHLPMFPSAQLYYYRTGWHHSDDCTTHQSGKEAPA